MIREVVFGVLTLVTFLFSLSGVYWGFQAFIYQQEGALTTLFVAFVLAFGFGILANKAKPA